MSVVDQLEVTELEILNVFNIRIQLQLRERVWVSLQLLFERLYVVLVHMSITKHMNEFTSL